MRKVIILFIFICLLPFTLTTNTLAKSKPNLSATIYSSSDVVTKEFIYDTNLELYINTSFTLTMDEEDCDYYFYALEYSDLNEVHFNQVDDLYTTDLITVNKSGKYTILLQSDTTDTYYTIDLIIYDTIESIDLVGPSYPLLNEEIEIEVLYNNSKTVLPNISLTWYLEDSILESSKILSNKLACLTLNPFTQEDTLSIHAEYNGIISNVLEITVQDLEIASSFTMLDDSKVFLKSDQYGYIKALVPKDSKPVITVLEDTYSVRYDSFTKEEYNDNYDLVNIKFELLEENEFIITILCEGVVNNTTTLFAKNVTCKIVSTLDSFIIKADKEEIGLGEQASFTASVNGSDSLDTNITWYVDNEEVSTSTYTFQFDFRNGGDHYVYAMINDIKSNEIHIFVNYTEIEMLIWYCLLGFALCFGIPMLVFLSKKRVSSRIKGINDKLKDYSIILKNLEKKYKKTKNKQEVEFNYKKVISKLTSLYNDADYESHVHKEAVYDDLKKNIDKARKILEVIVKLYKDKTSKEIAKLINDSNVFIQRSLDNIENIIQIRKADKARNKKHKR